MEQINLKGSVKTPDIKLDPEAGTLVFKGRSIPDNARDLYDPLINGWLNEYIKNPKEYTTADIDLEYFNTSTSMWLFHLFKKLYQIYNKGYKVEINWYYLDEDTLEAGEDFKALIPLPFNMINLEGS